MSDIDFHALVSRAWKTAEEHGWHERPVGFGDFIALCHSELSEALEAYREPGADPVQRMTEVLIGADGKPEGVAAELADVLIRIFDYSEWKGIPLGAALKLKMEYNDTRPYRHGGKHL